MAQRALYYPFIHIRDLLWLKGTLLLFRQVRRMVPTRIVSGDLPELVEFLGAPGGSELLVDANLQSERCIRAQERLAAQLRHDALDPTFQSAYGQDATRKTRRDHFGFQIHHLKLDHELKDALRATNLAWAPDTLEPYDFAHEYIEVHPRLGEAIMSTLAVACAITEGLDVVADPQSEPLHESVIQKDETHIYDSWLGRGLDPRTPARARAAEILEWVIQFRCNPVAVTPETLSTLDREPLESLIEQLRAFESKIPPMDRGKDRTEYLEECASRVIREWEKDRKNLSNFWKEFFGEKIADLAETFTKDVADKTPHGAAAGAVIGAKTATGSIGAGVAHGLLYGVGGALGIGVVFHGIKSYSRLAHRERTSPYRYLTALEGAGVEFRKGFRTTPIDVLGLRS